MTTAVRERPKCEVCGLDRLHADVADCMKDLMNYISPEISETELFKRVLIAGFSAMKAELKK